MLPPRHALPFLWLFGVASRAGGQETVALTGVTIIDVARGVRIPDQTVIWRGGRIVSVGESGDITAPQGASLVDGRSGFLIPGLWDMHVHAIQSADTARQGRIFRAFLANGVTGIRDMGSFLDTLLTVRQQIADGSLSLTPRLVAAGPVLDGPRFAWSQAIAWHIESPEQAAQAVDSLKGVGVDFLKAYTSLPAPAYQALMEEAHRVGLPVAGHIPTSVGALEAARAGQRSFEHNGMWVSDACVPDASKRINAALNRWAREGYASWLAERRAFHSAREPARCANLLSVYQEHGTWMVPTIVNELKDRRALSREAFRHLDADAESACKGTVESVEAVPDTLRAAFFADFLGEVGEWHAKGVPLLAGTDLPNPCLTAGFSLHDELEELVAAGLTPAEALATATINPARFLGSADSLGRVAPGYAADLLLLAADPLVDIGNTRRIRAVVRSGTVLDRAALDRMVAETRRP